jgi:ABC-type uncharacterized transport system substrate-binding protein
MHATSAIPVVFALWGDPIGSGYIASLARPGGNATGLSMQSTDIAGKRLELLREVIPGLRRLVILGGGGQGCALEAVRGVWRQVHEAQRRILTETTLTDLLERARANEALCYQI